MKNNANRAEKMPMMERLSLQDFAGTALQVAFYGCETDPDLADGLLAIVQEYQRRCDEDQPNRLRDGAPVSRRKYRATLRQATGYLFEPGYVHTERAVFRALATALYLEEPKPEPTYSAVTIMSYPATQTIQ